MCCGAGHPYHSDHPMTLTASPTTYPAHQRLLGELSDELQLLEHEGRLRRFTEIGAVSGACVELDGRRVVNWCSNDYLGLSTHPVLAEAAATAAKEWGVGSRASRLLSGTTSWHLRLEAALARWFGAEAAIVYPSGYQANLGTLGALLCPEDIVFVDRLAHASLIDAVRASRATLRVFRHNDASHLADLLARVPGSRRRLIVTEGVFSMEGDRAPLAELLAVAKTHDALVYVDDAHGAFVLGEGGRGAPDAAGLSCEPFIYMGTLGKALGCQGGFVVGARPLIDLLRNRARTFIYTTALAVPVVAAAVAALQMLEQEPERIARLWALADDLRMRLAALSDVSGPFATARPSSHIVPVITGSTELACELAGRLLERGVWAPAIRPPTVPEGTARLRVSLTALHTEPQIDELCRQLSGGFNAFRITPVGSPS